MSRRDIMSRTTPLTSYRPPLSCQILGAVVKALNIQDEALSTRTANRFYKGQIVGEQSKADIYRAVGRVLVDSYLVPVPESFAERDIDLLRT